MGQALQIKLLAAILAVLSALFWMLERQQEIQLEQLQGQLKRDSAERAVLRQNPNDWNGKPAPFRIR